jgi:hypothetical protein
VLTIATDSGNSPVAVDLSGTVLSVDPTTVAIGSSLNPSVTGTIQFLDGTNNMGAPQIVNSSSNSAAITTSVTVLGLHNITAVYSGDDANAASTSTPIRQTVEQTTHLNVTSSAVPATVFAPVTFSAALTEWSAPPIGSITFMDGSTSLASSPLNAAGNATYTTALLAAGNHNITATFVGDNNNFASSYSFLQVVNLASSTTTLSTSDPSISFGTPVTFTATVSGVSTSIPTGNVIFKADRHVPPRQALGCIWQ